MKGSTFTVGVVQAAPKILDLPETVDRACRWIAEAGRRGVRLLAFPETWIPGYPFWCDTGAFGAWGDEASRRLQARLWNNALALPSPELDRLGEAARAARCAVVLSVNERGATGSIYNTLVYLSASGEFVGRHRKLVPTHGERLIWGHGDAEGLRTHDLGEGVRVGGLICWEHWMPLPRHVLHAEGEQVHVAVWPHAAEIHQLASRHYAFEGRAFVLVAATYLERASVANDPDLGESLPERDLILDGGSAIIGPDASYVVEPVYGREELLIAELDLGRITEEKHTLDVAGHYSRPDLFDLQVRRTPLPPFRDIPRTDESAGGCETSST